MYRKLVIKGVDAHVRVFASGTKTTAGKTVDQAETVAGRLDDSSR